jgi:regulator of PEP synthase PpsR (kinase-PPPase family)
MSVDGDDATPKRTAFFVSDGTCVTAETLGRSLLTQFEAVNFAQQSLRFVNTVERASEARRRINETAIYDGARPLIFSTLVKPDVQAAIKESNALFLDIFATFINPLEQELGCRSSVSTGRFHGLHNVDEYSSRIEAVDFTLNHDDGGTTRQLDEADVILIGISRSGKTPTCLYLSLQYGVRSANFPITEDDLEGPALPDSLVPHRDKLVALSTEADRLQQIREARYPNSRYASFAQCQFEVRQAEALYRKLRIPCLKTTLKSIEEIAANILDLVDLQRPSRSSRPKAHV